MSAESTAPETVTLSIVSDSKTFVFHVKRRLPKKPQMMLQTNSASLPPISDMVQVAVGSLKERNGSSLTAIKKYIAAKYNVDVGKMTPLIENYLNLAVEIGALVRTKGKGASGLFKLPASATESKSAPLKKTKPATTAKKAATASKTTVTPKKAKSTKSAAKRKAAEKPVKKVGTNTSKKEAPPKAKTAAVKKTVPAKSPAKGRKGATKKESKK